MGQKVNPLVLRPRVFPSVSPSNFLQLHSLRSCIIHYFFKKGFHVQSLNVFLLNRQLFLKISVLTSKRCVVSLRKFRKGFFHKKNLRSHRSNLKLKKKKSVDTLQIFFKALCKVYNLRNVYFKFIRLNSQVNMFIASAIWSYAKSFTTSFSRRSPFILDLISISSLLLSGIGSVNSLNQLITSNFSRVSKRGHNRYFLFLKNFFSTLLRVDSQFYSFLLGFKILISGKFGGKTRGKHFSSCLGRVPTQTIDTVIDYSSLFCYTTMGSFGFKLWVVFSRDFPFCFKRFYLSSNHYSNIKNKLKNSFSQDYSLFKGQSKELLKFRSKFLDSVRSGSKRTHWEKRVRKKNKGG